MPNVASSSEENGVALRKRAALWLNRIDEARKNEKTWRDAAEVAVSAYTGEQPKSESGTSSPAAAYDFNMLFANVETIVPAVINSPPAPDIRRRFGSDDPVARDYAEMLERAIRVQVDDGRLQYELEAMAQDGFLAGRGVIRIRFESDFVDGDTPKDEIDALERQASNAPAREDDDELPLPEIAVNERVSFEAIGWRDCLHGPAKRWQDVPWWAFRHSMTREDYDGFCDADLMRVQEPEPDDAASDCEVWEIWDKRSRSVQFVSTAARIVIKRVDDPLGLTGFFPIATPVQPIEVNGRLMPVNPFSIYRRLADELDTTTKRIRIITKQLKVKGGYVGDAAAFQAMLDAEDNEFVPLPDDSMAAGGLEAAIIFWPVEKLIVVLRELYGLRENTKQAIYEITGISDIVRGASMASETATAQNIKSQWGSLRIQKMQRMMERAARDLFLMMAEIIPAKFSPATLQQMTEIQVQPSEQDMQPVPVPQVPPPQPGQQPDPVQAQQVAQAQEAEKARQERVSHCQALQALMQQKASTFYRIDVETDSTVKADLSRQKAESSGFMQAASGYFQAVGPLVQQGALPIEVAVEIFSSFSRMFNMGKSVEDALDELVTKAKEKAGKPPEADPAQEAAQAQAKAEMEAKSAAAQMDLQLKQLDGQIKQQVGQMEIEGKRMDLEMKRVDLATKQAMRPVGLGGPQGFGGFSNG